MDTLINNLTNLKNKYNNNEKIINIIDNILINQENNLNSQLPIIELNNDDFKNGTYRIQESGIYILKENITFKPCEDNDFMPYKEDIINKKYPVGIFGAYHLGFFSAITIECSNVILDLNGFSIEQSKKHNLLQRFYAHIELNSSPFKPKQGPHTFTDDDYFKIATDCCIINGKLDISSHHGIHGNSNRNICLMNLNICNFEVAGIALNGSINTILNNIKCKGQTNVKMMSSFSQSIFIRNILKKYLNKENVPTLNINGNIYNVQDLYNNITKDIKDFTDIYLEDETLLFSTDNESIKHLINYDNLYDGNMYGIVLNVDGVAVNDFPKEYNDLNNNDILLDTIEIMDIITSPKEMIALNSENNTVGGYIGGRVIGPIGDVFNILECSHTINNILKYKENSLSNCQLFCAKLNEGTVNIPSHIIEWAENDLDLNVIMKKHNMYFKCNGDSMGHLMKGNIGIFIVCGNNIFLNNIIFNNMEIINHNIGYCKLENKDSQIYTGSYIFSIACVCCKDIEFNNIEYIDKIYESVPNIS